MVINKDIFLISDTHFGHRVLLVKKNWIDVSVDVWDYTPIKLSSLLELYKNSEGFKNYAPAKNTPEKI